MKRLEKFASALFPIALLGSLAAATLWLAKATELPEPDHSGKFRHDVDYFIEDFSVSRLDKTGTLRSVVTAKRMDHYPDTDDAELVLPSASFLKPGSPVTTLSGNRGHINSDGSELILTENVRVVRAASKDREELVATGPDLTIYPDSETARTQSPVEVVQGKSWVRGTGLKVDNATMITTLESRVTGQFASKHEKH